MPDDYFSLAVQLAREAHTTEVRQRLRRAAAQRPRQFGNWFGVPEDSWAAERSREPLDSAWEDDRDVFDRR